MKSQLITRRRKEDRQSSFKTNHDLLKQVNGSLINRTGNSKSALDDHFPCNTSRQNHQSRPSLIQRKHHYDVENVPPNGQLNEASSFVSIKIQSLNKLINSIDKLFHQHDSILPIVKHKIWQNISEIQSQIVQRKKKVSVSGFQDNSKPAFLIKLEKKLQRMNQQNQQQQKDNETLEKKLAEAEEKLQQFQLKSSLRTQSVNAATNEQKRLRNIILSQSQVINEQLQTIESQKQTIIKMEQAKNKDNMLTMLFMQATTLQSLLSR